MDIIPEAIEAARAAFAEELRYVAHVRSDRVVEAFATVPRERFLGERPWRVFDFEDGYWETPGEDPRSAYHDVLFAIDAARELNNGKPQFWARLLDRLEIRPGDRVCQIGAGAGYYSAVIAELTGRDGAVIAVEIDVGLADRARTNLAHWPQVRLVEADGAAFDPGPVDAIVVNAGATRPMPAWLGALKPGGRMLLPLTAGDWRGVVFMVERSSDRDFHRAAAVAGVAIYPCAGARTPESERALARALGQGGQSFVRSLRLDAHARESTCWLHGEGYCLSTRA
jgi:protein-L-isoaspartate(D-aspartate) O-methyltransferase